MAKVSSTVKVQVVPFKGVLSAASVDLLRVAALAKRRGQNLRGQHLALAWEELCEYRYCAAVLELWDDGLLDLTVGGSGDDAVRMEVNSRGLAEGARQNQLLEQLGNDDNGSEK